MGIALTMKATIGLSAFDAFSQTVAYSFNFRVGDVVMALQSSFIFLQLVILKKEADWRLLLQLPIAIILGQFINIFYYGLFGQLVIEAYIFRIITFFAAQIWVSFFISIILLLDLVVMPIESFALVVSKRTDTLFGRVRQGIDIIFILLSLIFTSIFTVPYTIREGTVISAIMFGPLLSFFMPKIEIYLRRWALIE